MRYKTDHENSERTSLNPTCIRCGVIVRNAPYLHTICAVCIEDDYQALVSLASKLHVNGAVYTKGDKHGGGDRPAGDSGPSAGTLTAIGRVLSDEVPF